MSHFCLVQTGFSRPVPMCSMFSNKISLLFLQHRLYRNLLIQTYYGVAKDRSWFGDDYLPFKSVLENGLLVEGIGTVELPTKRSPSSSGPKSHTILRLPNVLHVPGAVCNILRIPLAYEYELVTNFRDPSKGAIRDEQGQSLAYFRLASPDGLQAVRLSGPSVGPEVGRSLLSAGAHYISAVWPDAEKQRWTAYGPQVNASAGTGHDLSLADEAAS